MGRKTKKLKKKQHSSTALLKAKKKAQTLQQSSDDKKENLATTTAGKYTVDQILSKVEEYKDTFQYGLAEKFCQRALEMEPDNVRVLETSGTLLLELGDIDAAQTCIGRAIELQPDEGHSKYMYMGQLLTGDDAIKSFQKGIEVMSKHLEHAAQSEKEGACGDTENTVTATDVSNAYCSIAEIYLTDACFSEDAEVKCKESLDKALEEDASNAEAYHLLASYYLSTENKQKAKESIDRGVSLWLPQLKQAEQSEGDPSVDPIEVCPVSYEARVNVVKTLIELEDHEMACEVLDLMLDENDNVPEVWYLLGWSNYLQGEDYKSNARFYLDKAQKVFKATSCQDEQLLIHIEELLAELGPGADDDEADGGNDEENHMEIDSGDEEDEVEDMDDNMDH